MRKTGQVTVAITADRLTRQVDEQTGKVFPVPDFTVEHWGIYEAPKLEVYPLEQFRAFVVRAFGGQPGESESGEIHGSRYGIPLFVGLPSRGSRIDEVFDAGGNVVAAE